MLVTATVAQDEGFGKLIGLLVAAFIAGLAIEAHRWWMERQDHSPTPPPPRPKSVSPAETDEPDTDDTDDSGSWWGRRIRLADGSTLVRRAGAVWSTGSSELPEDGDEDLVDEDGEPEEAAETRAEMADRLVRTRCRYSDAVREIMGAFDVSESTAKRDIGRAQERLEARRS